MPPTSQLDPMSSLVAFFANEVAIRRGDTGKSQEKLANDLSYSSSMIAQVETARRFPTREFAAHADTVLGANGALLRLWDLASKGTLPPWRSYRDLEASAAEIRTTEFRVVPGVLQVENYTRALMARARPGLNAEQLEAQIVSRMARRNVLTNDQSSAVLWAVIDESVVHRKVAGGDVMREQIEYLLEMAQRSNVIIQILPLDAEPQGSMSGPFSVLSFAEAADVAYMDTPGGGHLTTDPDEVELFDLDFDLVRAAALPRSASLDLLRQAMEDT